MRPVKTEPSFALQDLQARLGHVFRDESLLLRALTHRSFGADHNERLEFLGDAALDAAVSKLLFERFPQAGEGDLTRARAHLVREAPLHQVALTLGLPQWIRLSDGEAKGGGAQRASILADAMEAVLGAVWLDGGFDGATRVVEHLFGPVIAATDMSQWRKDPKTELQEWLQGRRLPVPTYGLVASHGQAHEQTFEVSCEVPELGRRAVGQARSRREAEQAAARTVLETLRAQGSSDVPVMSARRR